MSSPRSAEFVGMTAIVTGGGSGIGLAAAQTFVAAGASVAVIDLDVGGVPPGIMAIRGDVADARSVNEAVASVVRRHGGVDVLVNNAAVPAYGTVVDNTDDEWLHVLNVNVVGLVRTTRAAIPHLARSRAPAIVNTASVAAVSGMPGLALYSATKGAIRALTMALATDLLGDGIRVNCVSPGTVDSPWIGRRLREAQDPDGLRAALEARQPTNRLVSVQEVADAIAYLASPRARSTTGADLNVDGGFTNLRPTSTPGPLHRATVPIPRPAR